MRVHVAWSPKPGDAHELTVDLPEGSRIEDALRCAQRPVDPQAAVGIWGRTRSLDHPLADGDRVEVYRPLQLDPKEARRRRAAPKSRRRAAPRPLPDRAE